MHCALLALVLADLPVRLAIGVRLSGVDNIVRIRAFADGAARV